VAINRDSVAQHGQLRDAPIHVLDAGTSQRPHRVTGVRAAFGEVQQLLDVGEGEPEALARLTNRTTRTASDAYTRYPDSDRSRARSNTRRS
jgi:hypothetical protein